jgi:hypothetical protein
VPDAQAEAIDLHLSTSYAATFRTQSLVPTRSIEEVEKGIATYRDGIIDRAIETAAKGTSGTLTTASPNGRGAGLRATISVP